MFDKQWHGLFRDQLSFEDKRAVSALWDARKEWAHGERISSERTEHVLMDAEHILRSIGAVQQADKADEMRREFRRLMFEEDQKKLQRAQEKALSVQVDSSGLPAWRDVVEPHDDVARGTFELAQFAADLRQVHQGVAGPEYGDPVEFFGRTYLTRGLRYLLEQAIRRLSGGGGEPVIDLMTTFGGGKTHSLLAVYHAAAGMPAEKLPGMRELLDGIGVNELPAKVNRAVLVGNDLSILGMPKPEGFTVNTLWGELAYQLGGKEGYDLVARYDEQSVPPTTTALAELLAKYGPCIVLIDEWVAYLRQLWSRDQATPAGTFDGHMTFVQSLTEAVKSVPTALLVGEFVVRSFSPSLLRMQINRLNLWQDKPYVPVDTLVGYFSQYVYMPKVVQPKIVMDVVWHLDEVLSIELDGFAYADSYEDGRFVGLTVTNPTAVRQGGLLVDPKVALELIAKDTKPDDEDDTEEPSDDAETETSADPSKSATPRVAAVPKRFQATKDLTTNRVVRDVGQIYEEIVSHFVTSGIPIRVSIDIESDQLDKLTEDQRTAIRENLKSLGFEDDDWSMD